MHALTSRVDCVTIVSKWDLFSTLLMTLFPHLSFSAPYLLLRRRRQRTIFNPRNLFFNRENTVFSIFLFLFTEMIQKMCGYTAGQIHREPRCKYWATSSSVRLFTRTAHTFALLASIARSAALLRLLAPLRSFVCSLAHSLTPKFVGKCMIRCLTTT